MHNIHCASNSVYGKISWTMRPKMSDYEPFPMQAIMK